LRRSPTAKPDHFALIVQAFEHFSPVLVVA
jgi:hypothetical protein